MSRSSQDKQTEVLRELVRELRQCYGLGASFFRAAAARIEMSDTDVQVLEILERTGEASAGQLADLMGLTTGTFAGILNRLEKAGLVRRERDPADGRRVIVRLERDKDDLREISPLFDALGRVWEELASQYDNEQVAFLLEFLKRSNALSRNELLQLQAAPEGEKGIFSAPLLNLSNGQLVVSGAARLIVRAHDSMAELYQARFKGPVPDVKAKDGVVTIRYPRRLWVLGGKQHLAEVTLSAAIPWQITIQSGASIITAELGRLDLSGLKIKGGVSMIHLELPAPSGMVPVRISGSASEIAVQRPPGVPARVHLKGWASTFVFDVQAFSNVGNDIRLQSPGFDLTASGYDIEVASSVSTVTITTR